MKTKFLAVVVLILLMSVSCETGGDDILLEDSSFKEIPIKDPTFVDLGNTSYSISKITKSGDLLKSSDKMEVSLYMAEFITADGNEEMGNTIFFQDNGNKQLSVDFPPGGGIDGTDDVSYYVDESRPSGNLDVAVSTDAIDRAMETWDDVKCSDLGMFKTDFNPNFPQTGFVANILGYGGSQFYFGDVLHAGWLPGSFFDILAPGGSSFILGVTFTLTFNDGSGVAFREIYYNDNFTWNDGNTFDVETIALHEAGHGLSQAHFGKAFRTESNGKVHFSPRAVMNASYSGVQTKIAKTDNAGHCSNWAQWPNN